MQGCYLSVPRFPSMVIRQAATIGGSPCTRQLRWLGASRVDCSMTDTDKDGSAFCSHGMLGKMVWKHVRLMQLVRSKTRTSTSCDGVCCARCASPQHVTAASMLSSLSLAKSSLRSRSSSAGCGSVVKAYSRLGEDMTVTKSPKLCSRVAMQAARMCFQHVYSWVPGRAAPGP